LGPSRQQVDAVIFLNNTPLPEYLCDREPALHNYGFYRILNGGGYDFISFCNPEARRWISVYESDFNRILDKYLPPKEKKP